MIDVVGAEHRRQTPLRHDADLRAALLGEKEVAVAAFRKALDVFKDDAAASSRITAAASELGLKVE